MSVVSKIVSGFRKLALAIEGNEGIRARMNKGRNTVTLSPFAALLGGSVFSMIFDAIISISYMNKGNRQRSTILPSAPSVGLTASIPFHVCFPSIPSIATFNHTNIIREYGNGTITYSLRLLESLQKVAKAALGMVGVWMAGMVGNRSMVGLKMGKLGYGWLSIPPAPSGASRTPGLRPSRTHGAMECSSAGTMAHLHQYWAHRPTRCLPTHSGLKHLLGYQPTHTYPLDILGILA